MFESALEGIKFSSFSSYSELEQYVRGLLTASDSEFRAEGWDLISHPFGRRGLVQAPTGALLSPRCRTKHYGILRFGDLCEAWACHRTYEPDMELVGFGADERKLRRRVEDTLRKTGNPWVARVALLLRVNLD